MPLKQYMRSPECPFPFRNIPTSESEKRTRYSRNSNSSTILGFKLHWFKVSGNLNKVEMCWSHDSWKHVHGDYDVVLILHRAPCCLDSSYVPWLQSFVLMPPCLERFSKKIGNFLRRCYICYTWFVPIILDACPLHYLLQYRSSSLNLSHHTKVK